MCPNEVGSRTRYRSNVTVGFGGAVVPTGVLQSYGGENRRRDDHATAADAGHRGTSVYSGHVRAREDSSLQVPDDIQ